MPILFVWVLSIKLRCTIWMISPAYSIADFFLLLHRNIISVCWPGVLKFYKTLLWVLVSSFVASTSSQKMKGFPFSFSSLGAIHTPCVLPFAGFACVHWLDYLYACWMAVGRWTDWEKHSDSHRLYEFSWGFCRNPLAELGSSPPLPDYCWLSSRMNTGLCQKLLLHTLR